MRLAISFVLFLGLLIRAHGQEAAYLDTRAGSQAEPETIGGSGSGGGIGCEKGCDVRPPLKVQIQNLVLIDGGLRPMVEWTIRVANQTDKPVQLPSSLSWSSAVQSVGVDRRRVLRSSVSESASCFDQDGKKSKLTGNVTLYGSSDQRLDMVTVDPGQWVTLLGRGPACRYPRSKTDIYVFTVDVSTVDWYRENGGEKSESKPVFFYISSEPVKWDANGSYDKDVEMKKAASN